MQRLKLLLDENIGVVTTIVLRNKGYDVVSVLKDFAGITDEEVLAIAKEQKRILVTLDKDFGRLIFHYSQHHVGIIFLRLKKESAQNINKILLNVLQKYSNSLKGKFTTVTETKIRITS